MKKLLLLLLAVVLVVLQTPAQVGINTDNSLPDSSAGLDIKFDNKGVLIPRISCAQRNAISSPAEGLMVYCTNCGASGSLSIFTNGQWLTLSPCTTPAPTAGTPVIWPGQVIWRWNAVPGATGYRWNTASDYETATDVGTALQKFETDLVCNTTYNRFVWAYQSCGESPITTLMVNTGASSPSAPLPATNVPLQNWVLWKWHTVAGATGYRWNTINDLSTAIENGTDTTYVETDLPCGVNYIRYVWAYNGCGFSSVVALSGSPLPCVCGEPITDVRDGKLYNTVLIGSQCWMAQNLNIGTRISSSHDQYNNGILEKYCYDNDESNCDTYGGMYQWHEAMQYVSTEGAQGICPASWHVPTLAEFQTLDAYLGGDDISGGKMKETGLAHWKSPNTGAINSSGFTALPGGARTEFDWQELTKKAYFWTSHAGLHEGCIFFLEYDSDDAISDNLWATTTGLSVRCMKID